jgi:hypothetical protein
VCTIYIPLHYLLFFQMPQCTSIPAIRLGIRTTLNFAIILNYTFPSHIPCLEDNDSFLIYPIKNLSTTLVENKDRSDHETSSAEDNRFASRQVKLPGPSIYNTKSSPICCVDTALRKIRHLSLYLYYTSYIPDIILPASY